MGSVAWLRFTVVLRRMILLRRAGLRRAWRLTGTVAVCIPGATTAAGVTASAVAATVAAALALRLRSARRGTLAAAPASARTSAIGLAVAHALHHLRARSLGCGGHHLTARRLAQATPDGLPPHGDGLGLFARFRAEAVDDPDFDVLLGEALDVLHETFLIQADQAEGFAAVAGAAGAADPVHIVFADVRDFVVHHVRQLVDVDAAGRDVGRDQRADVAVLETGQRLGPGALALVAVQRHRLDPVLGQEFGDVVGTKLGACEHQHLAPVVLLDDVRQQLLFLAAADRKDLLGDALHRGVARRDLDALRIAQQGVGQVADLVAESGGEQQTLLFAGHQRQDLPHVGQEAHVQHPVCFVQDQHLHGRQVQEALLLQV